jgi:LysR family transcriptional regulator, glycine cleavage system transcriptional activator
MVQLPPLNAVRAFEAAARHSSFKRAAEELGVTDGAVSRHIALLEARLGVSLFRRLTRQVVLTPEGAALFKEVSPALGRIAMAMAVVSRRRTSTTLLVSAPPTFTMRWLIPRLSEFLRNNPSIDVNLTTSIKPVDFVNGGYDIAVRRIREKIPGVTNLPLMPEMRIPVCSPEVMQRSNVREPADLLQQTLIHAKTSPTAWAEWLAAANVEHGPSAGALSFDEMYFSVQAASNGLGFAIAPAPLVADDVEADRLVFPFGITEDRHNHYHAVFAASPDKADAVECFSSWMMEEGNLSMAKVHRLLDMD